VGVLDRRRADVQTGNADHTQSFTSGMSSRCSRT
jgi:hypothetical protein